MPMPLTRITRAMRLWLMTWPSRLSSCVTLRLAVPGYGGAEVRRIRAAARTSQPVFARLLEVLDPERVEESSVVRVRRAMAPAG